MKKHFQGLGHIAIYAKDLDESIAFYQKLGATLARRSPIQPPAQKKELALMAFDGFTLELIGSDAPQARGRSGAGREARDPGHAAYAVWPRGAYG